MANRTDAAEVNKIMDTGLEEAEITSIIDFANRMVTNVLGSEGLTDALLKDIETYLSAHLIATGKERQTSEEKVDDAHIKYTGKYGAFLLMTTYGQNVLMLDTTGNMANIGKQQAYITATPQYSKNYD